MTVKNRRKIQRQPHIAGGRDAFNIDIYKPEGGWTEEAVIRLEKDAQSNLENAVVSIREIKEQKLYAKVRIHEGDEETYTSFESYVAARWKRTAQWAYKEIEALTARELLLERVKVVDLNNAAILAINEVRKDRMDKETEKDTNPIPRDDRESSFLEAYQEALRIAGGKSVTGDIAKEAKRREETFYLLRQDCADLTREENRMLAHLDGFGLELSDENLVLVAKDRKNKNESLGESLYTVCKDNEALPNKLDLLGEFRGNALERVITVFLNPIGMELKMNAKKAKEEATKNPIKMVDDLHQPVDSDDPMEIIKSAKQRHEEQRKLLDKLIEMRDRWPHGKQWNKQITELRVNHASLTAVIERVAAPLND